MAKPIPLGSKLSQWRLVSVSGVLGAFVSDQNGLLKPENGLLSSMEVGLITTSVSDKDFGMELVNNLGEMKREEEVGFLYLSSGDCRELCSAIRAYLLLVVDLDLFLSIAPNLIAPLNQKKDPKLEFSSLKDRKRILIREKCTSTDRKSVV